MPTVTAPIAAFVAAPATALALALALFAGVQAHAQEAARDMPAGDASAGKALFQAQCLSCHGQNGASVIPANPILSGQHEDYLREQTAAYRDGTRKNAVMAGMAKTLTDQQIADISRYLATQQPVIVGSADTDAAALGERLYRGGSIERGLPACAACHGPAGAGVAALAPRLSGQHGLYTVAAINAYLNGERDNAQMALIAAKLSEEEIAQLAEFIAGLSY